MTKLTDTQLVLLSTAAARPDGNLLPPPDTLGSRRDRIHRSIKALVDKALAAEVAVADDIRSWRRGGDTLIGVTITDAGRVAVGVEPEAIAPEAGTVVSPSSESVTVPASKIGQVVTLLSRAEGATLDEMIAATGWLPHTTRAALTGLRKKGHAVDKGKRGDVTCYTIAAAA